MDTRSSRPTGINGCARHVDSRRILSKGSRLSRRRFGEFFGVAVYGSYRKPWRLGGVRPKSLCRTPCAPALRL